MQNNLLAQVVDVPTRGDNILDLCSTNDENLTLHVLSEPTKLSDHNLVKISTKYHLSSTPRQTKSNFQKNTFRSLNLNKADYESICEHLKTVNWDVLWQNGSY